MSRVKKNKKRLKKKISLIIVGVLILILSGLAAHYYFNPDSRPDWIPTPEPEPTLQIVDINSTTRSFAVVIDNHPSARLHHAGLQDAIIIYEMVVEGGMTRYLAIFRDANETERIGPVRSARHYYLDYALENDAVFVHHGQSPQAISDFRSLNIDRIVVDTTRVGWRDTSLRIASEHTLFTSFARLKEAMGNIRPTANANHLLLNYSVTEIDLSTKEGAVPAHTVIVNYPAVRTQYLFDAESGLYLRSVAEGRGQMRPHMDANTARQITARNIIVYQVRNHSIGSGGRQGLDNIGSGTGYFITGGWAVPITWSKDARTSQTIYRHMDGTPLQVNDGNTFIQIQPINQTLTIE